MENKPTNNVTERYRLQYRGVDCLNCGHPLKLTDKYCPNCSQANSTKKLTLLDFFEEFFANYFSYDSKLWRTLTALLLKPGKITRAYIDGKRLSYTNPFRFLLSLAIVYFLIISFNSEFESWNKFGSENNAPIFDLKSQIDNLEFKNEEEKKQTLAELDSLKLDRWTGNRLSTKDSTLLKNPKQYFDKIKKVVPFQGLLKKFNFLMP